MVNTLGLSPFTKTVQEFQQLGLLNKAVMDVVAVDIPLIALSKNEIEAKERFFRQLLVLLIAFVVAPFHARLASGLCAKWIGRLEPGLNNRLMRLPFQALTNVSTLHKGIHQLFENSAEKLPQLLPPDINESLRRSILKAKTVFLMSDLALCGVLLSSVGFLKTIFGSLMTGKQQFTGELGIVSNQKLNQLYQQENQEKPGWTRSFKGALTFLIAAGTPLILGRQIFKSLKAPNPAGFSRWIAQKVAPAMDYNYPKYMRFMRGWPLLSNGAQVMLSLLITLGELASARSHREFKELAIQRNSIDAMFFFGTPLLMKLLSGSTTIQGAIASVADKRPSVMRQAANRSAATYVFSFLATLCGVAGIIAFTNRVTRQSVQQDASQLPEISKIRPLPLAFRQFQTKEPLFSGIG